MSKKKALTQPMYYVLLSLVEERHGYEIMQYISDLTDSRVKVGPGTLYALLARFEEDGTIVMVRELEKKKTYKISSEGRKLLEDEIHRLENLLEDARKILGGEGDEI